MNCSRCNGEGTVTYQHGPPGSDMHAPASEIEWGPKRVHECRVCLGTGFAKKERKPRPERGFLAIHGDESTLRIAIERLKEVDHGHE